MGEEAPSPVICTGEGPVKFGCEYFEIECLSIELRHTDRDAFCAGTPRHRMYQTPLYRM